MGRILTVPVFDQWNLNPARRADRMLIISDSLNHLVGWATSKAEKIRLLSAYEERMAPLIVAYYKETCDQVNGRLSNFWSGPRHSWPN